MVDSLLHKVTGFVEIEVPDPPKPPGESGGSLPGVGSRPNPVPSSRPPLKPDGSPNAPSWGLGGIPWQPGSATAKPPNYGGIAGDSNGNLWLNVDWINAFIASGGLPQTDGPPPAPMIGQ